MIIIYIATVFSISINVLYHFHFCDIIYVTLQNVFTVDLLCRCFTCV